MTKYYVDDFTSSSFQVNSGDQLRVGYNGGIDRAEVFSAGIMYVSDGGYVREAIVTSGGSTILAENARYDHVSIQNGATFNGITMTVGVRCGFSFSDE